MHADDAAKDKTEKKAEATEFKPGMHAPVKEAVVEDDDAKGAEVFARTPVKR